MQWPPPDAAVLLAAWRQAGCPPVAIGPGLTVIDLGLWFRPYLVPLDNQGRPRPWIVAWTGDLERVR